MAQKPQETVQCRHCHQKQLQGAPTTPRSRLASNGSSFKSVGAILTFATLHGQRMLSRKADQFTFSIRDTVHG